MVNGFTRAKEGPVGQPFYLIGTLKRSCTHIHPSDPFYSCNVISCTCCSLKFQVDHLEMLSYRICSACLHVDQQISHSTHPRLLSKCMHISDVISKSTTNLVTMPTSTAVSGSQCQSRSPSPLSSEIITVQVKEICLFSKLLRQVFLNFFGLQR